MFTQQCFVYIKDVEKQKEVRQQLEDIGYKNVAACNYHVVAYTNGTALWMEMAGNTSERFAGEFYDCGDNVPLFLALAALTDEYFVADKVVLYMEGSKGIVHIANKGEFKKCEEIPLICCSAFHKATPTELIEHFNKN